MFHTRITALITSSFALLVLLHGDGFACKCLPLGPPCEEFWKYEAVFVGRATRSERTENHTIRTTFEVIEPFRGITAKEVDIFSSVPGASCGYSFQDGGLYFVYAHHISSAEEGFATNICTRTRRFSENSPDVTYARSVADAPPGIVISGAVTQAKELAGDGHATTIPLVGIKVSIEGKDREITVVTDPNGKYSISGLPAGDYTIKAALPEGLYAGPPRKVSIPDRRCAEAVFLARWNGRLSGTVVDTVGHRMGNVGIYLVNTKTPDKFLNAFVRSDEEGRYQFSLIQPGRYRMLFKYVGIPPGVDYYHPGVADLNKADIVSFGEGEAITNFALRLPALLRQKAIGGTVLDREGTPLRGVFVAYGQPYEHFVDRVTTDDHGHFSFEAYEGIRYSVMVMIPKGNETLDSFPRIEVPEDFGATPLRLVVDPKHPQESIPRQ